jgi:hypothetical protein
MTDTQEGAWRVVLIAAGIVLLLGTVVALAEAADDAGERLERKVRVMERVLDEVLLQSPNVLVDPSGAARGLVLEGYGILFTVEIKVGTAYLMRMPAMPVSPDGEEVIVVPRAPRPGRDWDEESGSWEEWRAESESQRTEHYAAFKIELIDALIDYGGTLSELADDRWVAVAAFLDGRSFLGGGSGGRLMIKLKMRDLRQYNSGALSRAAVIKKVVVEEKK